MCVQLWEVFWYSQLCERSVLEVSLLCFTSLINTWKKRKGHSTYLHNFSWRPVIASCLGIQIHKLDAHLQIHSNRSCVIFLDLNYAHLIFANIVSHKKTFVWSRTIIITCIEYSHNSTSKSWLIISQNINFNVQGFHKEMKYCLHLWISWMARFILGLL